MLEAERASSLPSILSPNLPLQVQSAVGSAHQKPDSTDTKEHARTYHQPSQILIWEKSAIIMIIINDWAAVPVTSSMLSVAFLFQNKNLIGKIDDINIPRRGVIYIIFFKRITGICWQAERIKQRKQIKIQKQIAESSDAGAAGTSKRKGVPAGDDEEHSSPPRKAARREGHSFREAPSGARKTDKGVISSLFRHNPDIPTVKRFVLFVCRCATVIDGNICIHFEIKLKVKL